MPRFPGLVRKFLGSRTCGGLGLRTGLKASGDGLMQGQKLPFPQLTLCIHNSLLVIGWPSRQLGGQVIQLIAISHWDDYIVSKMAYQFTIFREYLFISLLEGNLVPIIHSHTVLGHGKGPQALRTLFFLFCFFLFLLSDFQFPKTLSICNR